NTGWLRLVFLLGRFRLVIIQTRRTTLNWLWVRHGLTLAATERLGLLEVRPALPTPRMLLRPEPLETIGLMSESALAEPTTTPTQHHSMTRSGLTLERTLRTTSIRVTRLPYLPPRRSHLSPAASLRSSSSLRLTIQCRY